MTIRTARSRAFAATAAMGLLGTLLLWACHLGPEDSKDSFAVAGDPA